jgi:hypothetical protein
MHFEILVEDLSGNIALTHFLENILGPNGDPHTRRVISYKGIGRLPQNLQCDADPKKRMLLSRLPPLLRGYGKTFSSYGDTYPAVVIVVCDLDRRDHNSFTAELELVLASCDPRPVAAFRIAIEEGEAWLLGDRTAVETAYPAAKKQVLNSYMQDSICGTWEVLADAVHVGGAASLKAQGYPEVGIAKCAWASAIAPHVDINANRSPSFQCLRDTLRDFAAG